MLEWSRCLEHEMAQKGMKQSKDSLVQQVHQEQKGRKMYDEVKCLKCVIIPRYSLFILQQIPMWADPGAINKCRFKQLPWWIG